MKSLYALLRVHPNATDQEIHAAYQRQIAALDPDGHGHPADEDVRSKLVAVREAYGVLSDPAARHVYDQKLTASIGSIAAAADHRYSVAAQYAEPKHSLPLLKILLVGVLAIAALYLYTNHAKEQERQRIEAAKQVADRILEIEKQKQQMAEAEQAARLERQERMDLVSIDARNRSESRQAIREAENRARQMDREEESRRRQEAYERQRQESQAESRRRQERYEAELRVSRMKRAADDLARSNTGLHF